MTWILTSSEVRKEMRTVVSVPDNSNTYILPDSGSLSWMIFFLARSIRVDDILEAIVVAIAASAVESCVGQHRHALFSVESPYRLKEKVVRGERNTETLGKAIKVATLFRDLVNTHPSNRSAAIISGSQGEDQMAFLVLELLQKKPSANIFALTPDGDAAVLFFLYLLRQPRVTLLERLETGGLEGLSMSHSRIEAFLRADTASLQVDQDALLTLPSFVNGIGGDFRPKELPGTEVAKWRTIYATSTSFDHAVEVLIGYLVGSRGMSKGEGRLLGPKLHAAFVRTLAPLAFHHTLDAPRWFTDRLNIGHNLFDPNTRISLSSSFAASGLENSTRFGTVGLSDENVDAWFDEMGWGVEEEGRKEEVLQSSWVHGPEEKSFAELLWRHRKERQEIRGAEESRQTVKTIFADWDEGWCDGNEDDPKVKENRFVEQALAGKGIFKCSS